MKIEIRDLYMLLKAIEVASGKSAFNQLEVEAFKPSFDRVHAFLESYQNSLQEAAPANNTPVTETKEPVAAQEQVKLDPKKNTTKVTKKPKKAKGV